MCSTRRGSRPARGLRILLYHMVGTSLDIDSYGMNVSPPLFRQHMTWLAEYGSIALVPLEERCEAASDRPQVALTFDDGYRDALVTVAPILAGLQIPFTVFIVPAYVMSGDPAYLTTHELRELSKVPGCSIGSHGMTHRRLVELDDRTLSDELRESRTWLEETLAMRITQLSYPHGSVNQRVRDAAARAGYALGVCSQSGVNERHRDPLVLRRTEILGRDDLRVFQQKIIGGWDWRRFISRDPVWGASGGMMPFHPDRFPWARQSIER